MALKRRTLLKLTMLTGIVGFAGSTLAGSSEPTMHTVLIKDFLFDPMQLEVAVGDSIKFVNEDIVPHTATAIDDSWDTGELKFGESAVIEVGENFQFDYYCFFHKMMTASLVPR